MILSFRGTPTNDVPQWVTEFGWAVVVGGIVTVAAATMAIAIITAILFFTQKGILGRREGSGSRD